jgi:hypothetical protein
MIVTTWSSVITLPELTDDKTVLRSYSKYSMTRNILHCPEEEF